MWSHSGPLCALVNSRFGSSTNSQVKGPFRFPRISAMAVTPAWCWSLPPTHRSTHQALSTLSTLSSLFAASSPFSLRPSVSHHPTAGPPRRRGAADGSGGTLVPAPSSLKSCGRRGRGRVRRVRGIGDGERRRRRGESPGVGPRRHLWT